MKNGFNAAVAGSIAPLFGSILFVMLISFGASAQVQRTFVSGLGTGTTCSRSAPCRQFSTALTQTSVGGEVVVLDSAGYGAFSITQAVSITAPPGVYAGISVFFGDGIDINAGPSDTVILRGLTINNQGSTGSGIVFNTGGTLRIENVVSSGFNNAGSSGINFNGAGTLEVKDSALTGNYNGISVAPPSGTARAAINNVRLQGNSADGLHVLGGSIVSVRNSLASGNTNNGFEADATAVGAQLNLERCLATNNGTGVVAASLSTGAAEINVESCVISGNKPGNGIAAAALSTGMATVRVSNSMVTDNNFGFTAQSAPASILSRGNNTLEGNTTNLNSISGGTITTYSAQ
jgi:hypothetical protein